MSPRGQNLLRIRPSDLQKKKQPLYNGPANPSRTEELLQIHSVPVFPEGQGAKVFGKYNRLLP